MARAALQDRWPPQRSRYPFGFSISHADAADFMIKSVENHLLASQLHVFDSVKKFFSESGYPNSTRGDGRRVPRQNTSGLRAASVFSGAGEQLGKRIAMGLIPPHASTVSFSQDGSRAEFVPTASRCGLLRQ